MTYYERFGQTGPTPEGQVPGHEHDAGDITGTFGQIRLRGDLYSINWNGGIPIDLSAGQDTAANAGFALDVSAGAAQFANIYAQGGNLGDLSVTGTLTLSGSAAIESDNYVAGVSGWQTAADGTSELNELTARGAIYAESGELETLDILGTLTLGVGGVIRTADTGLRVEMTADDRDRISLWEGTGHPGEAPGRIQAALNCALYLKSPLDTAAPTAAAVVLRAGATRGRITAAGDLVSDVSGEPGYFDLGISTAPWRNLYAENIYDDGGNLRLDLSALSYGANDSGGVGYKVIRVPN